MGQTDYEEMMDSIALVINELTKNYEIGNDNEVARLLIRLNMQLPELQKAAESKEHLEWLKRKYEGK